MSDRVIIDLSIHKFSFTAASPFCCSLRERNPPAPLKGSLREVAKRRERNE